jgi:hypothetical protein
MMARGHIPRPGAPADYPAFSGRLTIVTGEGEQVELAFTAATGEELAARLAAAGAAATARRHVNNEAIVRAGDTFEARQEKVYNAAVAALRGELGLEPSSATADGGAHADAGGPLHSATDT